MIQKPTLPSLAQKVILHTVNEKRTQAKINKINAEKKKDPSHISQMIVATASRLAFQALPLMLLSPPTTIAAAAKIAAKSVYMGLVYNIAPKILNKFLPKPKNETVKTVSDNIMQSSIAAIGSGMLTTALGGPQYTLSSILKETLQEIAHNTGGKLSSQASSRILKDNNRPLRAILGVLFSTPMSTIISGGPKNLRDPYAYSKASFSRAAINVNIHYGKETARKLDKLLGIDSK